MSKGLIFFFCACGILLFTIINLSIGPVISGKVGYTSRIGGNWNTANCAFYSYLYDEAKKIKSGNELKYNEKWTKTECERKKAMYNMEYTSFIFNIVIGFVCSLLGLLHYFEVKKDFVVKTGIIGLCCGVVGFVFSFVYVIFNGIVYTTYYDTNIYKTDGKGAFAEWKNDKYECFYYDKPKNDHAIIAKYSDLMKKQYNYNNDLYKAFNSMDSEELNCLYNNPSACNLNEGYIPIPQKTYGTNPVKKCDYLYYNSGSTNYNTNKDKSDRFLTALILSLLVCLANIGLTILGFLLFRTGEF